MKFTRITVIEYFCRFRNSCTWAEYIIGIYLYIVVCGMCVCVNRYRTGIMTWSAQSFFFCYYVCICVCVLKVCYIKQCWPDSRSSAVIYAPLAVDPVYLMSAVFFFFSKKLIFCWQLWDVNAYFMSESQIKT